MQKVFVNFQLDFGNFCRGKFEKIFMEFFDWQSCERFGMLVTFEEIYLNSFKRFKIFTDPGFEFERKILTLRSFYAVVQIHILNQRIQPSNFLKD